MADSTREDGVYFQLAHGGRVEVDVAGESTTDPTPEDGSRARSYIEVSGLELSPQRPLSSSAPCYHMHLEQHRSCRRLTVGRATPGIIWGLEAAPLAWAGGPLGVVSSSTPSPASRRVRSLLDCT